MRTAMIDMRRDVSIAEIKQYFDGLSVGFLNRWFMLLVFRAMLIKRAYPLAEICRMTAEAGWREPKLEVTPVGFEAWMKK